MQAYLNDSAVKTTLLARLDQPEAAQQITSKTLAWNGEQGSVVGYLMHSEQLADWQTRTGLPGWLGLAVDTVGASVAIDHDGVATPDTPARLARALLAAVPPGSSLPGAGARFLQALLSPGTALELAPAEHLALRQALDEVAALHGQSAAGQPAPAAAWRAARKRCTALVDSLPDGSPDKRLGSALEAACWDALQSDTVVSDTLRHWLQAVDAHGQQAYGWTEADDAQVRSRLDGLYQAALQTTAEENINVFELYERDFPAESARTRGFFSALKTARAQALTAAVAVLTTVVSA